MGTPIVLASREREVLWLLVQARTDAEIADELTVSLDTVKNYVKRLRDRLEARNRVGVAVKALQLGLVGLQELPDPRRRGLQELTAREESVLALLLEGCRAPEAAERLGTTTNYVRYTEQAIRRKWHVTSRDEVLAIGLTYKRLHDLPGPAKCGGASVRGRRQAVTTDGPAPSPPAPPL